MTSTSDREARTDCDMGHPVDLDVIELIASVDPWAVGTTGTVVDDHGTIGMIEVSDDEGRALGFFEAPCSAVKVVWSATSHHAVA